MSECRVHAQEISDVALGSAASPQFGAHLETCAACSQALESRRALARRLGVAVDALVRRDPPADLAATVAARMRTSTQSTRRSFVPALRAGLALVAAVVATFFIVRAVVPPPTPATSVEALDHWRSPTASLLEPPAGVRVPPRGSRGETPPSHAVIPIGAQHVS